MNEVERFAADALAAGERVALATVVHVSGSAPRDEGASMAITQTSRIAGSVSGGCVDGAVVEEALGVIRSGAPKLLRYGIDRDMMWDVGLSCGGTIDVFVERLAALELPPDAQRWTRCVVVRPQSEAGRRLILVEHDDGPRPWRDGSLDPALSRAVLEHVAALRSTDGPHLAALDGRDVFFDVRRPRPRLVLVGAVHVAAGLCALAHRAGFEVVVIDPRERLNNRERFPLASELILGWPEDALPTLRIDADTAIAVLAHDEKFDDPSLVFALRSPAGYIGAIGSKKTARARLERLRSQGFGDADCARVHGPIGLDIGARTPEEIAVAVLAEIIAARNDRRAAHLRDRIVEHIHAS